MFILSPIFEGRSVVEYLVGGILLCEVCMENSVGLPDAIRTPLKAQRPSGVETGQSLLRWSPWSGIASGESRVDLAEDRLPSTLRIGWNRIAGCIVGFSVAGVHANGNDSCVHPAFPQGENRI